MADWSDGYWQSGDGLTLHYRDYPGSDDPDANGRPPILCIPGLTRNARDFEAVAARLSPTWRVICVDLRGRGESAHARDASTYVPLTYVQDIDALLDTLALRRLILFGTSLGGLITMLLAMRRGGQIAGALLNDIGPVIDRAGLARIRSYVGRSHSWPTWLHAARHFADAQADIFPRWGLEQWLVFAKRLCRLNAAGRIVLDYDMRIAEPFREPGGETGFDPWAAFRALADVPLLVVRGGISDLLADDTLRLMHAEIVAMDSVVVPDVGHAPTLDEPEVSAAIDRLLARIEG